MNRDTERSNFSDAQLFENRIRIRTYGQLLSNLFSGDQVQGHQRSADQGRPVL